MLTNLHSSLFPHPCNVTSKPFLSRAEVYFPTLWPGVACSLASFGQKKTVEAIVCQLKDFCSRGLEHFCGLSKGPRFCHVNKLKLLCWHMRIHIDQSWGTRHVRESSQEKENCSAANHRWMRQPAWNRRTTQLIPA